MGGTHRKQSRECFKGSRWNRPELSSLVAVPVGCRTSSVGSTPRSNSIKQKTAFR